MWEVTLELDCPPQIFFIAYFNLDLLFINIERTSWSKNPDTGSPKEEKRRIGIVNERNSSDVVHRRALFSVYCTGTDKLWTA